MPADEDILQKSAFGRFSARVEPYLGDEKKSEHWVRSVTAGMRGRLYQAWTVTQHSVPSFNHLSVRLTAKHETHRGRDQPTRKSMPKANRIAGTIRLMAHEFGAFQSRRLGINAHFHPAAPHDSRCRLWWRQDGQ
jgi:hypothetical protein